MCLAYNPCVTNNHVDDNYNKMTTTTSITTPRRHDMPSAALRAWRKGCVVARSVGVNRVNRIYKLGGMVGG
jgi:hypothetical protein